MRQASCVVFVFHKIWTLNFFLKQYSVQLLLGANFCHVLTHYLNSFEVFSTVFYVNISLIENEFCLFAVVCECQILFFMIFKNHHLLWLTLIWKEPMRTDHPPCNFDNLSIQKSLILLLTLKKNVMKYKV
jgi:hypothetical protein